VVETTQGPVKKPAGLVESICLRCGCDRILNGKSPDMLQLLYLFLMILVLLLGSGIRAGI
jgi:hypothetical protein